MVVLSYWNLQSGVSSGHWDILYPPSTSPLQSCSLSLEPPILELLPHGLHIFFSDPFPKASILCYQDCIYFAPSINSVTKQVSCDYVFTLNQWVYKWVSWINVWSGWIDLMVEISFHTDWTLVYKWYAPSIYEDLCFICMCMLMCVLGLRENKTVMEP